MKVHFIFLICFINLGFAYSSITTANEMNSVLNILSPKCNGYLTLQKNKILISLAKNEGILKQRFQTECPEELGCGMLYRNQCLDFTLLKESLSAFYRKNNLELSQIILLSQFCNLKGDISTFLGD